MIQATFLLTMIFIFCQLFFSSQSIPSVSPTWLPNTFFQTYSYPIKQGETTFFNYTNPITKTIPFIKTYTVAPKLAYGLKNYRGNDKFGQEKFAFSNTGLTQSGFTVYTVVVGTTNLRIVTLIYLAVDRSFPYHLNTFNDLHANVSNGNLVNISGTTSGQRQYVNTINYTTLANSISSPHNKFGANLSKNYVALYLCGLFIEGTDNKQVKIVTTTTIINIEQFTLSVVVDDGNQVDIIKFSMVAFDIDEVQQSGQYTIVFSYQQFTVSSSAQQISIPQQFATATFIGLTDFTATDKDCGLQFNWQLDTANDKIVLNKSFPYRSSAANSSAVCGLDKQRLAVFYVKTWLCPSPNIYFNLNTNLCDDYCAKYLYANVSAAQCQPCILGCYQCINGPFLGCTSCNAADFRTLASGSCNCNTGYYPNPNMISTVCLTCSSNVSHCSACTLNASNNVICSSCSAGYAWNGASCISCTVTHCTTTAIVGGNCVCSQCDTAGGYVTNGAGGCVLCTVYLPNCLQCSSQAQCTVCNTAAQFFLNTTTNQCQSCSLTGCTTCTSLVACQTCNTASDYFYNNTTFVCDKCSLTQCLDCTSMSQCLTCNTSNDYFVNASNACQACSLSNCLDCNSLTQCLTCDVANDFFLNTTTNLCVKCPVSQCTDCSSISLCSVCNISNNYFVNGSFICQLCTLNQCLTCTSLIQCSVCNTASDYFLNSTTKLCEKCTLNSCIDCASALICLTCNSTANYFLNGSSLCEQCDIANSYFLNTSTNLCQSCSLIGCTQCNSFITCISCDISLLYDLNTTTNTCYFCDSSLNLFVNSMSKCQKCSLTGCTLCGSLNSCITCNNAAGYFIDINDNLCYPCAVNNCTTCLTLNQCSICNTVSDYFLNTTTKQCDACSINQCLDCVTQAICLTCNTALDFFLNGSNICQQCSLTQCLDCTTLAVCSICNNANGYFINTTTNQCQLCTLLGCSTCTNLNTCSVCDRVNMFDLNATSNLCFYCDPNLNMFFDNVNDCHQCTVSHCIQCSSLNSCSLCDNTGGYFINLTNSLCYPCTLIGCLTCQTLTTCSVCDTANDWGLAPDGTCKQCPFTCLCDGYILPKYVNPADGQQYCTTLCGDGLMRNFEECDDGNTNNGDGCSSKCTIQKAWSCNSNSSNTCCTLQNSQIQLLINKIIKVSSQNSMALELQIKPTLPILTSTNLQNSLTLTVSGVPLYNQRRTIKSGQVMEVTYDYNQSIQGKKGSIIMSLSLSQSGAPSCVISASKSIQIMAHASNNLPFMFYDQKDMEKQKEVQKSAETAEIMAYVVFFLSMIPCKIIGLQLIGVLQLAYFSLAQQQNINLLLQPFMKMNELNGLNFDLATENKALPDQVESLGIKAQFLNNCNLMLGIVVAQTLVALALYIGGKFLSNFSQKLSSISKYLIKQILLTLMMFNAFNIAFGVGIHFQYADKNNILYAASTVAAIFASGLIFASCALLMFSQPKQFGQFKDKLRPQLLCQLYFVFSLAYRYALGYYIAVKTEYTLSSLIIVGFSFVFIGYNLINLPFKDAYQNYRASICHISQLIILFVANYYDSLTENQPMTEKAYQFNAAELQVAVIYVSVGFSAGCLFVEAYKWIKSKIPKTQETSPLNSMKQSLPNSEVNQTIEDLNFSNNNESNLIFEENELPKYEVKGGKK